MSNAFPTIECPDDVLPAIAGRIAPAGEFVVARRDDHVIVDYLISIPGTGPESSFPDPATAPDEAQALLWAIRRECRGLIFDLAGRVVSRPWSKFFNVGEKLETQPHVLPWPPEHVAVKLDGSMVRAFRIGDEGAVRWATRLGESPVARKAGAWVQESAPEVQDLAAHCLSAGLTPLFEWCDPQATIVVRHAVASMVFLGARDMTTGSFLPRLQLEGLGRAYGVPVSPAWDPGESLDDLLARVAGLVDAEGVVLAWPDGRRAKAKGVWYVRVHRAKDGLQTEKDVLALLLDQAEDDVLSILPAEDAARLVEYAAAVRGGLLETVGRLTALADRASGLHGDRRAAFDWLRDQGLSQYETKAASEGLSGSARSDRGGRHGVLGSLEGSIRLHLGSQPRVDRVRHLWGSARWKPLMWEQED